MTAVVLAAGYATRLYPLTRDTAKPLLEVAGRTILDRIVDNLARVPSLTAIVVVSNARFHSQFEDWAARRSATLPLPVSVLNDGSTANENRLGALADLRFAVRECNLASDALVVAGDNLYDFELAELAAFFEDVKADCITAGYLAEVAQLRRTGVAEIAADGRVLTFEEKPSNPRSNWGVPPLYCYRAATLHEPLEEFLSSGANADAPGSFVPWLLDRGPVYAYRFTVPRYDIGTLESYAEVDRIFAEREGARSSQPH